MELAQRLSEIRELDWLAPITREALLLACTEARELRSPQVYPEHLLLGLLALEGQSLGQLFQANSLGLAQARNRVQERSEQMVGPLLVEEITFSDEARECLRRAVAALVSDPPQPGVSKRLSPELLTLSLLAHARVQRVLASAATLV